MSRPLILFIGILMGMALMVPITVVFLYAGLHKNYQSPTVIDLDELDWRCDECGSLLEIVRVGAKPATPYLFALGLQCIGATPKFATCSIQIPNDFHSLP